MGLHNTQFMGVEMAVFSRFAAKKGYSKLFYCLLSSFELEQSNQIMVISIVNIRFVNFILIDNGIE